MIETLKCHLSPTYFINTYCRVRDEQLGSWVSFKLWPAQARVIHGIHEHRLVAILKARQLGMSWCVIAYLLWQALLHPSQTILLFSRRDDEAMDLLVNRFRAMHQRLPAWLRAKALVKDNDHDLVLSNGSRIMAFPATGGDSYTASIVLLDEIDLILHQDELIGSVKPTIDAGGRLILLSRADKSRPESAFKRLWRAAPDNGYHPIFLGWPARPGRDAAWYETVKREIEARTGATDELYEQYPATPEEALAPPALSKRLPVDWLAQCFQELSTVSTSVAIAGDAPTLPQLRVYRLAAPGRAYVLGGDPALGNPNSDDSSITVLDQDTGEEAAALAAKVEPGVFAATIATIAAYYNHAGALVERNNHGHAVLLALKESHPQVRVLCGPDGKPGWNTTAQSKCLLYDTAAEAFRDRKATIHDRKTFLQLASIEASTLAAPEGQHDDSAVSFVLALMARAMPSNVVSVVTLTPGETERPSRDPDKPLDLMADVVWPSESPDGW